MNKLELFIYNSVKNNPSLKQKLVDLYQLSLSLVPQKQIKSFVPMKSRDGFFFGFHDKTPFSSCGTRLLAHKPVVEYRHLKVGDEIEVGFFDGPNWENYCSISKTKGWNWQLGSMLQWYGDDSNSLIHNEIQNDSPVAILRNLQGQILKTFPYPVVHVSSNRRYYSSYNFARSEHAMPGYGMIFDEPNLNESRSDTFKIYDIEKDQVCFEMSLEEIIGHDYDPCMEDSFHFFHHSLFNPSGNRLFFLHRWVDSTSRRWTRMFSVNPDGSNLFLFPMNEMVSHITWASDTKIFTYARYPGKGDGYYLLSDQSDQCESFLDGQLNSDGHPTLDLDRGFLVTDSYPDRFRNQKLIFSRRDRQCPVTICETHLPMKFRRFLQVDLHPRIHPTMPIVCADSAHTGRHSLLTFDIEELLR